MLLWRQTCHSVEFFVVRCYVLTVTTTNTTDIYIYVHIIYIYPYSVLQNSCTVCFCFSLLPQHDRGSHISELGGRAENEMLKSNPNLSATAHPRWHPSLHMVNRLHFCSALTQRALQCASHSNPDFKELQYHTRHWSYHQKGFDVLFKKNIELTPWMLMGSQKKTNYILYFRTNQLLLNVKSVLEKCNMCSRIMYGLI